MVDAKVDAHASDHVTMPASPAGKRSAAATKMQAVFRATMLRRTMNEATANVAIVATKGFGDLIGRNDIRNVLDDLQMQKRRLSEKIDTLEHNMYYAKASRQKEIRRLGKIGRKKLREIQRLKTMDPESAQQEEV